MIGKTWWTFCLLYFNQMMNFTLQSTLRNTDSKNESFQKYETLLNIQINCICMPDKEAS